MQKWITFVSCIKFTSCHADHQDFQRYSCWRLESNSVYMMIRCLLPTLAGELARSLKQTCSTLLCILGLLGVQGVERITSHPVYCSPWGSSYHSTPFVVSRDRFPSHVVSVLCSQWSHFSTSFNTLLEVAGCNWFPAVTWDCMSCVIGSVYQNVCTNSRDQINLTTQSFANSWPLHDIYKLPFL